MRTLGRISATLVILVVGSMFSSAVEADEGASPTLVPARELRGRIPIVTGRNVETDHRRVLRACGRIRGRQAPRRSLRAPTVDSGRGISRGSLRRLCELYKIPSTAGKKAEGRGARRLRSEDRRRAEPRGSRDQEFDSQIYAQLPSEEELEEVALIDEVSEAVGVPLSYNVGENDDGYFELTAYDLMVRTPKKLFSDSLYLGIKVERTDVTNRFLKNLHDQSGESGMRLRGVGVGDGVVSAFAAVPW